MIEKRDRSRVRSWAQTIQCLFSMKVLALIWRRMGSGLAWMTFHGSYILKSEEGLKPQLKGAASHLRCLSNAKSVYGHSLSISIDTQRLANVRDIYVSQELISTRTEYLSSRPRATTRCDEASFIITLMIRIWFPIGYLKIEWIVSVLLGLCIM